MKKKNRQIHYKTAGFKPSRLTGILILAGLILAASAAGLLYYRNINRYVFAERMVYYTLGVPYEYGSGDRAVIEKDGSVSLISSGRIAIPTQTLPLYSRDRDAVVTVCPMSYYSGSLGAAARGRSLDRFTDIEMIGQDVNIIHKKDQLAESGSFLYDGEDTYVLLTEATLNIGSERSLKLSPLSYVIAVYDCYVMYYDHASDSFEYVTFDLDEEYQNVSIVFPDESTVNCDLDVFIANDAFVMLPSAVEHLQSFF